MELKIKTENLEISLLHVNMWFEQHYWNAVELDNSLLWGIALSIIGHLAARVASAH